jgi:hypothetical protein
MSLKILKGVINMRNVIDMLKGGYCIENDREELQEALMYSRGIDREEAEELLEELELKLTWGDA